MSAESIELLAESQDVLNVAAAFFGGLFIAGALILAVRIGMRVLDKDIHHPTPEEQPRLPMTGPIHEEREMREPDEVPVAEDGTRLLPHEFHRASTKRGKDQRRRRWLPGSSGGFGSGGLGHV